MAGARERRPAPPAESIALPELPDGWHLLGHAVLADGALGLVGTDCDIAGEWRRGAQGEMTGKPFERAAGAQARFFVFDGAKIEPGPQFALEQPWALFDRFLDGRWLVAAPRARRGEANARIIDPEGREVRRMRLGDGIEHIGVGADGLVWTGWFDEGVFGNDNWLPEGSERPPSSHGLAAFDETGAVVFAHDPGPNVLGICDCYALNVSGAKAWACPYDSFEILSCEAGHHRSWPGGPSGTQALAVARPHILAAGGYGADADRIALLRLGEERAETLGEWRMPLASQRPEFLVGRDDAIHLVEDGCWHRWRVGDFLAVV